MLRVCICDDDRSFLHDATEYIEKNFDDLKVKNTFTGVEELRRRMYDSTLAIDLFLLDIRFDGEESNGIQLAGELNICFPSAQIIFLSNYPSYISDVYETAHCCFVVKSQLDRYLPSAIDHARRNLDKSLQQLVVTSRHGEKRVVRINEILFLERKKRTTQVVLKDDIVYTSVPLSEILSGKSRVGLVRCHNSFIVNLRHVRSFSRGGITMNSGEMVPISRFYLNNVRLAFSRYMQEYL